MTKVLKTVGIVLGVIAFILIIAHIVDLPGERSSQGTPAPAAGQLELHRYEIPPTGELTILEERLLLGEWYGATVQGLVQNTSDDTFSDVVVCADWYDTQANRLGSGCDFAKCALKPEEVFKFQVTGSGFHYTEVSSYEITVRATWIEAGSNEQDDQD